VFYELAKVSRLVGGYPSPNGRGEKVAVFRLVVCHGFSFGLLAFEICAVDHHSEDAVFEGEDNGLGSGLGDRAGVTGHSQSVVSPTHDQVVLVIELEAGNGLSFASFDLFSYDFANTLCHGVADWLVG